MSNTVSNVTYGKPKKTGAVYWAPSGTTLPTDASTSLDAAFVCLGYVSEDGVTNSNSPSSESIKAWGGDSVMTVSSDKADEWSLSLIEALNVDVLKAIYGPQNVSGTLRDGIVVRANSDPNEAACWVIDMLQRNNTMKRVVIPAGTITNLEDISYKDADAVAYGITISASPGDESFGYDTHKEYIATA